jgi:uncharacterized repeat protein (TIGR03837 family)
MRLRRPVWINLEYLSAESWVEGSHGLPSPKPDGLVEHFFFPGFTDGTGGLLREVGLLEARDRFTLDRGAVRDWLRGIGVVARPDERLLSLFCYPHAPAAALLDALAASGRRWRVLLPEGVLPLLSAPQGHRIAVQRIPFLPHPGYDRLLWACDANFVRGEDSLVRALWAARPTMWQAYPQSGDAHVAKLTAFLRRFVADAALGRREADAVNRAHLAWNSGAETAPALLDWLALLPDVGDGAVRWVAAQAAPGADLASRLVRFAASRL